MFEDYPTKSEAEDQAREYATPLNNLITPQEVDPDAQLWSDVDPDKIERECSECASIITSEHREMQNLIQDLAFRLWTDDFQRQPREILADAPDVELIHVYQIWPNDMDKWEFYELAHKVYEDPNTRIPDGYYSDAMRVVERGLMEGTKPE